MLQLEYGGDWIPLQKIEIFIENTDFKFTYYDDPQPPVMTLVFDGPYRVGNSTATVSVNFTVSKCEFHQFNDDTNTLAVDLRDTMGITDIYFSILDSHIHYVSHDMYPTFKGDSIVVNRGWSTQVKINSRMTGNTMEFER